MGVLSRALLLIYQLIVIFEICGSSFARRRLPVVMKKSGMVNGVNIAADYVEQVGPLIFCFVE